MKPATVSLLMVAAPFFSVVTAASLDDLAVWRRIEVRVETVANREGGPVTSCEVVLVKSASSSLSFASWSTLGDAGADVRGAVCRCGAGSFPGIPPAPSRATSAPFLIHEVSAIVGWDSGTMDPGAVGALGLSLTLSSRQLSGFSPDGAPLYSDPAKHNRTTRLEPGEEYLVPVLADVHGHETAGVHEIFLRIRAGWAGRDGATEYGGIAVVDAVPGSEVVLDGGVAGRAAADGTLLLANVPVGLREVSIRETSRPVVSHAVLVVKGRTVVASAEAVDSGSPPSPVVTRSGKNAQHFDEYRRMRDGP